MRFTIGIKPNVNECPQALVYHYLYRDPRTTAFSKQNHVINKGSVLVMTMFSVHCFSHRVRTLIIKDSVLNKTSVFGRYVEGNTEIPAQELIIFGDC